MEAMKTKVFENNYQIKIKITKYIILLKVKQQQRNIQINFYFHIKICAEISRHDTIEKQEKKTFILMWWTWKFIVKLWLPGSRGPDVNEQKKL